MSSRLEQYALIGDTHTGGLVGDDGSLDWLCVPRFDSPACFAALLGDESHGHWRLAPASGGRAARRRYREGTLVLETEFETPEGAVRLTDFMPLRDRDVDVVRIVEGLRGEVPMRMQLVIRFDYGSIVPWVRRFRDGIRAIAGPDGLVLRTPVPTYGRDLRTYADFTVSARERVPFVLSYHASPSSAAKHAGESKRGTHSQSSDPSSPTSPPVCVSPISAYCSRRDDMERRCYVSPSSPSCSASRSWTCTYAIRSCASASASGAA